MQGRRTTVAHAWPLEVPDGNWAVTLRTTWVEPAYLEPDASWCRPGGEPASALANGGGETPVRFPHVLGGRMRLHAQHLVPRFRRFGRLHRRRQRIEPGELDAGR